MILMVAYDDDGYNECIFDDDDDGNGECTYDDDI